MSLSTINLADRKLIEAMGVLRPQRMQAALDEGARIEVLTPHGHPIHTLLFAMSLHTCKWYSGLDLFGMGDPEALRTHFPVRRAAQCLEVLLQAGARITPDVNGVLPLDYITKHISRLQGTVAPLLWVLERYGGLRSEQGDGEYERGMSMLGWQHHQAGGPLLVLGANFDRQAFTYLLRRCPHLLLWDDAKTPWSKPVVHGLLTHFLQDVQVEERETWRVLSFFFDVLRKNRQSIDPIGAYPVLELLIDHGWHATAGQVSRLHGLDPLKPNTAGQSPWQRLEEIQAFSALGENGAELMDTWRALFHARQLEASVGNGKGRSGGRL